jgi:hypothetical protein
MILESNTGFAQKGFPLSLPLARRKHKAWGVSPRYRGPQICKPPRYAVATEPQKMPTSLQHTGCRPFHGL